MFREHGGRSRCTYHVSLQRFIRGVPFPPQGPFGMVPLARRYYETLRLPTAHFAALCFLRLAIPSLRPSFVPDGPGHEAVDHLELVSRVSGRHFDGDGRVSQVPGGTLVIIRHTPPTPV